MLQFWEKHKKRIIGVAAAVLVVAGLLFGGQNINASALENVIGFVVTPFQDLTTGIGNWVENTRASARDRTELLEENERLREEIETLREENRRLALYEEENASLSELLQIAQRYPEYETTGARVIAKSPGVWYDTFTINKGTSDGLSADMVLTAPGGLVGRVLESGSNYSKAESILDSRSSVPAMSARTGDLGVVKGDYSFMAEGLCIMEYIDADAEIVVGDEIVTSHLSEIYPQGISIGRVTEIETDSNGLTKYAVIEPFVDMKHIEALLVIDKGSAE